MTPYNPAPASNSAMAANAAYIPVSTTSLETSWRSASPGSLERRSAHGDVRRVRRHRAIARGCRVVRGHLLFAEPAHAGDRDSDGAGRLCRRGDIHGRT